MLSFLEYINEEIKVRKKRKRNLLTKKEFAKLASDVGTYPSKYQRYVDKECVAFVDEYAYLIIYGGRGIGVVKVIKRYKIGIRNRKAIDRFVKEYNDD